MLTRALGGQGMPRLLLAQQVRVHQISKELPAGRSFKEGKMHLSRDAINCATSGHRTCDSPQPTFAKSAELGVALECRTCC